MKVREFPVLTAADQALVDRIAVGLGEDSAKVLAYLLLRADQKEFAGKPASLLAIRIGTELNCKTVRDVLNRLEERDLVVTTTIQDETRGRPPKAWHAADDAREAIERVYEQHAQILLERAARFPDHPDSLYLEMIEDDITNRHSNTSLSFALNWCPNGLHAPFFIADKDGEYANQNLSVQFEACKGSHAALDSVVSEKNDVGIAGAATLLRARSAGKQILPIASLFQHAMTAIYALEDTFDGQFEHIAQLRGRRIGMPAESEIGLLGRLFLLQAGVWDHVKVIDLRGEECEALLSGEVDAVTGSFSDPRRLMANNISVESMLVAERFPIPGSTLVTTESELSNRRPELTAFLAATAAGWATAMKNPIRAVEAIPIQSNRSTNQERSTFEEAAAEFGENDAVRKWGWGWQKPDTWRRLETALKQVDILNT